MDESELIAAAIKYHGIDVPVQAIRKDGEHVVIVIQGGQELSCKLSQLQSRPVSDLQPAAQPPKKSAPKALPQNPVRAKRVPKK
jgi:hypothetical protein